MSKEYWYGERWDDTKWPIHRIVVKMYTDGTEEEVFRSKGTTKTQEGQNSAYNEVYGYINQHKNYNTQ